MDKKEKLSKILKLLNERHEEYFQKHMNAAQEGGQYSEPYYDGYCDALDDVIKTIETLKGEIVDED